MNISFQGSNFLFDAKKPYIIQVLSGEKEYRGNDEDSSTNNIKTDN